VIARIIAGDDAHADVASNDEIGEGPPVSHASHTGSLTGVLM
jgi:hypothetical protein